MDFLDRLPTLASADLAARVKPKSETDSRVDLRLERESEDASNERAWNKAIDLRDGRRCRACGKRTNPDDLGLLRGHRAHIVYASAGGSMAPSNRVTLCAGCHSDEHKDRLRFTPEGGPYVGINADEPMEFWRKDDTGSFYLSVREEAVGRWERD